jgi:hypothetical protein
MEEEVTKERFKHLYFIYATAKSGWTEDYWNHFYDQEEGMRYCFERPKTSDSTRMFIVSDVNKHRMIFLIEDSEESFFDYPGKE